MNLCWKYFVPIGIVLIIGEVIWMYFIREGEALDSLTRISLFFFAIFGLLYFFYKVYVNLKKVRAKIYLNPFV
jgi:hypothetical protein